MFHFGVFISLNFLVLILGIQELSGFAYQNSMSFLPANFKSTVYSKGNYDGVNRDSFCLGPFYEKSELYRLANTLRNFGVFPKKEMLEVDNSDQIFAVFVNNFNSGETGMISKELNLLDIAHFKVPSTTSAKGTKIYIEFAEEDQARESQLEDLASLGRPWEYLRLERQSTLYFLKVPERDRGKLSHMNENRCIGIAPLH